MARPPGGILRATPVVPSIYSAPGVWTLAEVMLAKAEGKWPRVVTTDVSNTDNGVVVASVSSFSHASRSLGTADSERYIIFFGWVSGGTTVPYATVSIGGVAATQILNVNNTGNFYTGSIWYAKVPTGTTGTLSGTFSGTAVRYGWGLFRVVGISSITPFATATDITNPTGVTMDIPAGGFAIAIDAVESATSFTWSGMTKAFDNSASGWYHSGAFDVGMSAETGRSISVTDGTNAHRVFVAASWI